MVKLFISQGADLNAKDKQGEAPLHWAIEQDYYRMIKVLVKKEPVKDNSGETPLHWSVDRVVDDHKKLVKLLLEHDVSINIKDKNGETPLYRANERGRKDIVKVLKNAGA